MSGEFTGPREATKIEQSVKQTQEITMPETAPISTSEMTDVPSGTPSEIVQEQASSEGKSDHSRDIETYGPDNALEPPAEMQKPEREGVPEAERNQDAVELLNPVDHEGHDNALEPPAEPPESTVTSERPEGIPECWEMKSSRKGNGMQFINPENMHDRVRVMPGNPESPNAAQRVDYVKRQIDGICYDAQGNEVSSDSPESHIPATQFSFRG